MDGKGSDSAVLQLGIVVVSALLWAASVEVHVRFLQELQYARGIDMIFLPAGIRLLLLLVGRFWAALGITIGSMAVCQSVLGPLDPLSIVLISAVAGFGPYLFMLGACRLLSIDGNLVTLRPLHLPVLSFGVALGSALLNNLTFLAYGFKPLSDLLPNITMMTIGDFLGSFAMVVLILIGLKLLRR